MWAVKLQFMPNSVETLDKYLPCLPYVCSALVRILELRVLSVKDCSKITGADSNPWLTRVLVWVLRPWIYHIQMNEGHSQNVVSFIVLALSSKLYKALDIFLEPYSKRRFYWRPWPLPVTGKSNQQITKQEQAKTSLNQFSSEQETEREPEQYHGWSQAIFKAFK